LIAAGVVAGNYDVALPHYIAAPKKFEIKTEILAPVGEGNVMKKTVFDAVAAGDYVKHLNGQARSRDASAAVIKASDLDDVEITVGAVEKRAVPEETEKVVEPKDLIPARGLDTTQRMPRVAVKDVEKGWKGGAMLEEEKRALAAPSPSGQLQIKIALETSMEEDSEARRKGAQEVLGNAREAGLDMATDLAKIGITLHNLIATGGFGEVYCGSAHGKYLAVKVVRTTDLSRNEHDVLRSIYHHNVVKFFTALVRGDITYVRVTGSRGLLIVVTRRRLPSSPRSVRVCPRSTRTYKPLDSPHTRARAQASTTHRRYTPTTFSCHLGRALRSLPPVSMSLCLSVSQVSGVRVLTGARLLRTADGAWQNADDGGGRPGRGQSADNRGDVPSLKRSHSPRPEARKSAPR